MGCALVGIEQLFCVNVSRFLVQNEMCVCFPFDDTSELN